MTLTVDQRRLRSDKTKRWQAAHPEQAALINRRGKLRRMYNLTPDEYDRLFDAQHGVCAICLQPETQLLRGKVRQLAVDHDHDTHRVRGLLCHYCNLGLGRFRDNPSLLAAAIRYLEEVNTNG